MPSSVIVTITLLSRITLALEPVQTVLPLSV